MCLYMKFVLHLLEIIKVITSTTINYLYHLIIQSDSVSLALLTCFIMNMSGIGEQIIVTYPE
jgi:hypothetical protein